MKKIRLVRYPGMDAGIQIPGMANLILIWIPRTSRVMTGITKLWDHVPLAAEMTSLTSRMITGLLLILITVFFISPAFANSKIIRFATEATYPPYVYMKASGHVGGFGAAIVHALCKQMKATCTISNQPWDSLIPSLTLGKFDALFGGIAITSARQKQVNFTHPYYKNTVSFVADKNTNLIVSKKGLQGKVIGVQGGSAFDSYLQNKYGNIITIHRYPSEQEALMDLTFGRLDAVVGDTPLIKQWLKQAGQSQYVLVGKPINDPKYFGQGVGIATRKGNQALVTALNKALTTIKANGTYANIVRQYFGNQ